MIELEDSQPAGKRMRMDVVEQEPASTTIPAPVQKDTSEKVVVSAAEPTTGSVLPGLNQAGLPYLLCDPILLAVYYQAALAAATTTIRAATFSQAGENASSVIPPSLLPHPLMTAPVLQNPQKQQQSAIAAASQTSDGFGAKTGNLPMQTRERESQQIMRAMSPLDEQTAAAALKLLQLHAGGDFGCGSVPTRDYQKFGQFNSGNYGQDEKFK